MHELVLLLLLLKFKHLPSECFIRFVDLLRTYPCFLILRETLVLSNETERCSIFHFHGL